MAFEFKFPDVGEGITEGEIVKWKVKEGDKVDSDQPLVEIETDKAVVDIPSPKAGKILHINGKEGQTIKVGDILVIIGEEGEKVDKSKDVPYTGSVVGFLEEASDKEKVEKKSVVKKEARKIVKATPAIRNLAKKLKININNISGTGTDGRITKKDLENTSPKAKESGVKVTRKYDLWGYIDHIPLKGLRKSVSKHMFEAHSKVVPITNIYDATVTNLVELRSKEKKVADKKGLRLTFLPFIIKAVISALRKHPIINSSLENDNIIIKKYYNIGVAVDTDDGLIVPVVKAADSKNIFEIASELQELSDKAKVRKLDLMDMKGGSFTVTNLGSVGVKYFTPMVNYPEAAILGPGRIRDKVVVENGKMVIKKVLPLSFTYDHRIIDGAEASRFMNDLISYLENPATIYIEEKENKKK